jgi:membrane protease YdiL (CAAX protease family)
MKGSWRVLGTGLLACGILYGVEQGLHVNYLVQSLVKIALFLGLPLCFYLADRRGRQMQVNRQLQPSGRGWGYALLLGLMSFAAVLAAYFLLKSWIDFAHIVEDLQERLKVTQRNYLLIGAYVVLVNSFLEEVFFRGFLFARLYQRGYGIQAYLFSSILFALYHVSIFRTWFSGPLMALALTGLTLGGLIFCWLNRKTLKIHLSWTAHIFADLAIIWIGYTLFF